MSSLLATICATLALTLLTTASCSVAPSQLQPSPTPQRPGSSHSRIAIPEIKGCVRDQITFYKGKVQSFKRDERSLEITVRTEWDTTEKLTSDDSKAIEFRVKGKPAKDEQWKTIENALSDSSPQLGVTVWVCKAGDREQIKIIDWDPPASK
jgi:hypothetical protein